MKREKSQGFHRPFKDLRMLLQGRSATLPSYKAEPCVSIPADAPKDDRALFLSAVSDVKPLPRNNRVVPAPETEPAPESLSDPTAFCEALEVKNLENLIETGSGFAVADTPEYIEGTGYRVHPEIAARLHRGEFAIQAYVDLHGLRVSEAEIRVDAFLQEAVAAGKRGVLIVHGRGLSSRAEPILKAKLEEWLAWGHWRKWIVAYTSARLCDGGAGATYVLLRKRPATKRQRKKK